MVKDDLSCCLSDFGLALAVESQIGASSSSRAFLGGSLRWMPPEIMDESQFDPAYITARDVYSFGCTVIEVSVFAGHLISTNMYTDIHWQATVLSHSKRGGDYPRSVNVREETG